MLAAWSLGKSWKGLLVELPPTVVQAVYCTRAPTQEVTDWLLPCRKDVSILIGPFSD